MLSMHANTQQQVTQHSRAAGANGSAISYAGVWSKPKYWTWKRDEKSGGSSEWLKVILRGTWMSAPKLNCKPSNSYKDISPENRVSFADVFHSDRSPCGLVCVGLNTIDSVTDRSLCTLLWLVMGLSSCVQSVQVCTRSHNSGETIKLGSAYQIWIEHVGARYE